MFSFNEIGQVLRFSLFGGSHQKTIGGELSNFPSEVVFDNLFLEQEIDRRRPLKHGTPRKEEDKVIFEKEIAKGEFIPSHIRFYIENKNIDTNSYEKAQGFFRPSHADYVYYKKYSDLTLKYKDEASGRITLPMVVAGALCKMFLRKYNILIEAKVEYTGKEEYLEQEDSIGGKIICRVRNMMVGLGEPIFYKVQSLLAQYMMSLPSAVSFEMGDGVKRTLYSGSEDLDNWTEDNIEKSPYFKTITNHCGGVNAGISNGNDMVFLVGFHPVHTLEKEMKMIDRKGKTEYIRFGGRHDKAHIFRLPVVVEALTAMVITDLILMDSKKSIL
ncbi:MAG: chorismate synthase [Bacteroidota bacterium]|nr:chorismate synthase [Bacteroidota bacterium]